MVGSVQPTNRRGALARSRRLPAAFAGILLAASLPLVAFAHNWGAGDSSNPGYSILCTDWSDPHFQASECTPDNAFQTVWISGVVPSGLTTALKNSVANDYDAIYSISAVVVPNIDSFNDVRIWHWNEDPTLAIAFTTCNDFATQGFPNVRYHMWCKPQDILYQNNSGANSCWNSGPCRRHYACHELGHTFGLQHPTDLSLTTTCMSYASSHPEVLRPHDVTHLEECLPHPTPPLPTYPAETRTLACKN